VDKTFTSKHRLPVNAHDSEKVIGTLLHQGYSQVDTPEAAITFFSTPAAFATRRSRRSSIASSSLSAMREEGQVFAVIGCVAQQEGEKIFEKAPHVSLVAGSASYTKLPQMLVAARSRQPARHRLESRHR